MKAAILALAAAYANAQSTVVTTQNECWNTQGGYYAGNCRDVYYLTCDEYVLFGGSSCNVFTFSDSRIEWTTSQIQGAIWEYYLTANADPDIEMSGDLFDDGTCYAISDVAEDYPNGEIKNWTTGMCGFKYQVTNLDADYENKFTVLKDGASALLAGSAMALAAALAF